MWLQTQFETTEQSTATFNSLLWIKNNVLYNNLESILTAKNPKSIFKNISFIPFIAETIVKTLCPNNKESMKYSQPP